MLTSLRRSLRGLLNPEKRELDMNREILFHIECETEKNIRRGLSPDEARRAAMLSFGGIERIKEEGRHSRKFQWVEELWRDLQYAVRILRRDPGFTLVALLTLALGIGVNTAIFSVIYGVLLKPLPFEDGNRIVVVRQTAPLAGQNNVPFSVKEIADYREQNTTFNALVEHHSMSFTLLGGKEPELIQTGVVSWNFFDVLGVRPMLGRAFLKEDEGSRR